MEFDQLAFMQNNRELVHFRNSVDRLLFRHDGSDIRRFSLHTKLDDVFVSSSHVNAWVSFALQHNVEHLNLWNCSKGFQMLPRSFYSCRSLTVLCLISVNLKFPSFVHFPVLKSFHLENLEFYGKSPINELVSSCTCPMLEELEINFCHLDTIKSLSISNPGLKYLKLFDWNDIAISVSVPNLRKLDCSFCRAPTISSETLMSLVSASFEFMCSIKDDAANDFLIISRKIVEEMPNVQELELFDNFVELLSRDQDLVAHLPSSCRNLKHVRLGMFPTNVNSQVIKLLLRGFTNLQSLCVCVQDPWEDPPYWNINKKEEYLEFKELPSTDVLTCLRTVEINDFNGSEGELDLLRYLLQNAKHLEKINISKSNVLQDGVEIQSRTRLSTFTRVARNVAINWMEPLKKRLCRRR